MNTALLLAAAFDGRPAVPLEEICEQYFGLSKEKANAKASVNELPVPTFRAAESQKAPRLVHVDDLAKLLDAMRAKATQDWERSQV